MKQGQSPISDQELHAYVDGTLSGERRAMVDALLQQDEAIAAKVGDYFALNTMLHDRYDRVLDEPLPERLRPEIRKPRRETVNWPQFAGMAAALVFGIGIGLSYNALKPSNNQFGYARAEGGFATGRYTDGVVSFARQAALAHVVYSPDLNHPVKTGSDHEQELVKWLSSRIGMNVRPPVFAHSGFQLIGGRLLRGTDGPIAEFMYNDASGERITLCISRRNVQTKTTVFHLYEDGPVKVFYWVDGDIGYAVSGGIDHKVLLDLAHDAHEQLSDAIDRAPAAVQ